MNELAVHWHQGMFLRPHHFQAADRYWHDQLQQSSRWDVHYNWGVRSIEINHDALQNYRFEVRKLECRLEDGTMVRVLQGGQLPALEIREALTARSPLQVALAIPRTQLGRNNVSSPGDATARYAAYHLPDGIPDENTGQNNWQVQFRRVNVRLITNAEDYSGFVVLPLARVERSGMAEAVPKLDDHYIPPLLGCDGWEPLQVDILQQIYHRVSRLMKQRAQQVSSRRITFDSQSPGDRRIFEGLRLLNEVTPYLRVMAHAKGVHPLWAYMELCRLVGRLAIFGRNVEPPDDMPLYDHDDLGNCFHSVKKYIDAWLDRDFDLGYEEVPFVGSGLRMKVDMKPQWMAPGYQIFVGVECLLPAEQVIRLLRGGLNMKIGSLDNVDDIFQRGLRGLALTHKPQPPRALPQSNTLTYFQINPDASPEEWQAVKNRHTIAIRLNEKLIAGSIEGQTEVAIHTGGGTTKLQFTLFVVSAELGERQPADVPVGHAL